MEMDKREETQIIKPLLQMFLSHYQETKILFQPIYFPLIELISQIIRMDKDRTRSQQIH